MIKLLIDLLSFLRTCAPLLTSLIILVVLCVLLSKSIRKHATIYYIVLGIPFALVALPFIGRMFGLESNLTRVPFLGEIIRDYIHMGALGHPLLIIIMYMGALNPKIPAVNKLLSIRKELSIISGFPVLTHSLIRVTNNFPNALQFFTSHSEYLEKTKVVSELGAGFSSFSYVLGIIMLILFLPLWITSFGGVRKRMGHAKWKKLQKWSYVLYATLFIHAMGIQVGGMLNPRGGQASKPATEVAVSVEQGSQRGQGERNHSGESAQSASGNSDHQDKVIRSERGEQRQQTVQQASKGRTPTKGFADIKVSAQAKRYIHIISLVLIYGSYLFFRIRKAKRDAQKKAVSANG